jgi:hypothetical protein
MKDHAWVDFEMFGTRHRFSGAWPDDARIDKALAAAKRRMEEEDIPGGPVNLIRAAGGTIIEVHSVREDGSIRAEDLPDLKIY